MEVQIQKPFILFWSTLSYFGCFLTGIFYTYGLTVPLAIAVLIAIAKNN